MFDDDEKPVTRADVKKTVGGGCLTILGVGAVIGICVFVLYIMACANMPTGCH